MNKQEAGRVQGSDETESECPGTRSPGRTDDKPDRELGIELPDNEEENDVGLDPDLGDLDPDEPEMDDQPPPR